MKSDAINPERARFIAMYLPQFHPIAENDAWWGRGFTEWTNVARAKPLFRGHRQPQLPAHLGYYDLRLPEARRAQAELAARYGIEAFCYWHYWFHGKRLLERPFNEVLDSGQPDFPFCLAWANENWSRTWLGDNRQVLQAQTYSDDDDLVHARWLSEAFADPRYLRVGEQPLFIIYRPTDLPQPQRTADTLREVCVRAGMPPPLLLAFNAHCPFQDTRSLGFDGTIDFEPQLGDLPQVNDEAPSLSRLWRNTRQLGVPSATLKIYDYDLARQAMQARPRPYPYFPSVVVAWDNTPRRGERGVALVNSTPARFEAGLRDAVAHVATRPPEQRLVFINAWNEWAEGNHLEPDLHDGLGYLEAVRRVSGGDGK